MSWRDDAASDEYDLDDEAAGDAEDDQLPCPSCGRLIFEDSERCPHCGDWVMPLAAAAGKRKTRIWWTALALAVILLVTWGVFG